MPDNRLLRQTDKGVLLYQNGGSAWVPKSRCGVIDRGAMDKPKLCFVMSVWIAQQMRPRQQQVFPSSALQGVKLQDPIEIFEDIRPMERQFMKWEDVFATLHHYQAQPEPAKRRKDEPDWEAFQREWEESVRFLAPFKKMPKRNGRGSAR